MTLKGRTVVVHLQSPREKFWGILRQLEPAGALVEGVDAEMFESWARETARAEEEAPPAAVVFFPSGRIEKIILDRSSRLVPSLEDRFRRLVGRTLASHLGRGGAVRPFRPRKI
jgi:hypothetical protein